MAYMFGAERIKDRDINYSLLNLFSRQYMYILGSRDGDCRKSKVLYTREKVEKMDDPKTDPPSRH